MKKTGDPKKTKADDPVKRIVQKVAKGRSLPAPKSGIDFSVQRKAAEAVQKPKKKTQQPVLKTHNKDMDDLIRMLLDSRKSKTGVNAEWVIELFRVSFPYTKAKLLRVLRKDIPNEALCTEIADGLFQRFGA